jgi:hypothetical protein
MANEKKSLVEEALLQMKNLEEAVTENAKGILASTMKQEISELVKESLLEQEEDEIDVEMSDMVDMDDETEDEIEMSMDMDMDSDEESEMEDEMGMELPDELEVDDEEEVLLPLDLTGASDEEILKVFKAMGEQDGIIVKQDGDEIHLKDEDSDVEYIVQTESEDEEMTEMEMTDEMMDMKMSEIEEVDEMEDVVYEIEIDEEEDEEEVEMSEEFGGKKGDDSKSHKDYETKEMFGGKKGDDSKSRKDYETKEMFGGKKGDDSKSRKDYEKSEGETIEAARTYGNGSRNYPKREGLPKMKVRTTTNEGEMKSEIDSLRAKNEEYRKALNIFREKLNEVAVFNSNLAYTVRLFTEHSTTKQEKINILRRFDSVENIKESKSLYKTIREEMVGKEGATITESVESKVQKSPTKGSATNLIESKTYENPQFMRMKDLMNKINK